MISKEISESLKSSSWIRAMFEQGNKLRKKHGSENVFDFSIGNPDPEPPHEFIAALEKVGQDKTKGTHKYMSNAGHIELRKKIAKENAKKSSLEITENNVIMTCGAAGGLNVCLKTILDKEDEVIVLLPFFAEYKFYIQNANGKAVFVDTDSNFQPDIEKIKNAITNKTKAIILNSPNNPTGVIYTKEILNKLSNILKKKEKEFGTDIYVFSDEPYRDITFNNKKTPNMLNIFDNIAIVYSYSKAMSIPGERIGYILASPKMKDVQNFINGAIFCNRTLGFVNAPAFIQRVLFESLDSQVDMSIYEERMNILYNALIKLGFECEKPDGAFYLFPKSPIDDDIEFVNDALKYNLLLVPGTGFGKSGYFRLSYCINKETIKNSLAQFEKLAKDYNLI